MQFSALCARPTRTGTAAPERRCSPARSRSRKVGGRQLRAADRSRRTRRGKFLTRADNSHYHLAAAARQRSPGHPRPREAGSRATRRRRNLNHHRQRRRQRCVPRLALRRPRTERADGRRAGRCPPGPRDFHGEDESAGGSGQRRQPSPPPRAVPPDSASAAAGDAALRRDLAVVLGAPRDRDQQGDGAWFGWVTVHCAFVGVMVWCAPLRRGRRRSGPAGWGGCDPGGSGSDMGALSLGADQDE